MAPGTPAIEYTHFINWLQNNRPALYTEYWRIIEPANNNSSVQLNLPVTNDAVTKKLEQATGEYLEQLRKI